MRLGTTPVHPVEGARPLLIGAAPGPNTKREHPLLCLPRTSAGARLKDLMGLTSSQYIRTFDRINLVADFPGKTSRGDKFPLPQARATARAMQPLLAGRTVFLVGSGPRDAFGFTDLDWHTWTTCPEWGLTRYAAVPHPSGRNHWYNKPLHRQQAEEFWSTFLDESSK